jgi:hypothetical protein
VTIALEPGEASKTLGYDAVHYETLKGQKGYLRSHVFQLVGSQAANAAVSEERTLPKFLAVHEFEDTDIPSMHIEFNGPDESRPIFKDCKKMVRDIWELTSVAGDEKIAL